MELYQAEWCPHSRKIRQRLTELGVDVHLRQVPAEEDDRDALRAATGTREIPVLIDGGETICGEDDILAYLDRTFEERPDAAAHRRQLRDKSGVP
jgi:glutathione S-transferase